MAIDTTPSTVATNALQAIPFSALIGGPLDACIQAQAQAAKTSWEFINAVGLTIDPETNEKKAITVAFEYNNNGKMTTLVVPLIILLPIPYMAIDTVTIDFMANISAASSSVQETSEDTELGVAVDATASLNVGPFSLNVTAKANYSAKSHSKAAQESRYSVEYTMQVHVAGGQADMPAGLQTVLNILSGSVSSVSGADMLETYPRSLPFDKTDTGSLQVTIKNNYGVLVEGTNVSIQFDNTGGGLNPFESISVTRGVEQDEMARLLTDGRFNNSTIRAHRRLYGIHQKGVDLIATNKGMTLAASKGLRAVRVPITLGAPGDMTIGVTDNSGQVSFQFKVKESVMEGVGSISGRLLMVADIPTVDPNGKLILPPQQETQYIAFQIIPDGRIPAADIETDKLNLEFTEAAQGLEVVITATASGDTDSPRVDLRVDANVSITGGTPVNTIFKDITVIPPTVGNLPSSASGNTDGTGKVKFTFKTLDGLTDKDLAGVITISAAGVEPIGINFTVVIPSAPLPIGLKDNLPNRQEGAGTS